MNQVKKILNRIYKYGKDSFYEEVQKALKNKEKKFIITVNPEIMMNDDDVVQKMLNDKNVSLVPDGISIVKAARNLGIDIKERITGVDLADELLNIANNCHYSLYLLGAKKDVVKTLAQKIESDYPNINLLGFQDGYGNDKDKDMEKIIKLKPDIVLIALGVPMQEKLIYKHFNKAKKGIFIGVGGTFDCLSGSKKRAPKIFIKLNLEWLYRLIKEPSRLKRFWQNNIKFMFKVRKEK